MARVDKTLTIDYAREVFEQCPAALKCIFDYCLHETAAQRKFSMRAAFEQMKRKEWTSKDGGSFKVSNNIVAPTARILIKRYPQCRPYIKLCKAVCDQVEKEKRDQDITSTTTEPTEDAEDE